MLQVIEVAHRLASVLGHDLVAVVAEGKIVESGPPSDLLNIEGSMFGRMWTTNNRVDLPTATETI
jgi:ABC-type multidrug transport system fused ATPase/permease subunit